MTTRTIYIANSGERFDTEKDCRAFEEFANRIDEIMQPLGKPLSSKKSGYGWVQHSIENVRNTKIELLRFVRPMFEGRDNILAAIDKDPLSINPYGVITRIIDDSGGAKWEKLRNAWYRFTCIDGKWREHNQPYFALNSPDPKHVCVEDRS